MAEKIKQPEWHPDFGLAERHPTAGTVAIGARMPLVAYNINLNTPSLEIAHDIAKKSVSSAEDCVIARQWEWS